MKEKQILSTLIGLIVGGIIGYLVGYDIGFEKAASTSVNTDSTISSFEECVAAGNPVMESYPRQCIANGVTYVEDIDNELQVEY